MESSGPVGKSKANNRDRSRSRTNIQTKSRSRDRYRGCGYKRRRSNEVSDTQEYLRSFLKSREWRKRSTVERHYKNRDRSRSRTDIWTRSRSRDRYRECGYKERRSNEEVSDPKEYLRSFLKLREWRKRSSLERHYKNWDNSRSRSRDRYSECRYKRRGSNEEISDTHEYLRLFLKSREWRERRSLERHYKNRNSSTSRTVSWTRSRSRDRYRECGYKERRSNEEFSDTKEYLRSFLKLKEWIERRSLERYYKNRDSSTSRTVIWTRSRSRDRYLECGRRSNEVNDPKEYSGSLLDWRQCIKRSSVERNCKNGDSSRSRTDIWTRSASRDRYSECGYQRQRSNEEVNDLGEYSGPLLDWRQCIKRSSVERNCKNGDSSRSRTDIQTRSASRDRYSECGYQRQRSNEEVNDMREYSGPLLDWRQCIKRSSVERNYEERVRRERCERRRYEDWHTYALDDRYYRENEGNNRGRSKEQHGNRRLKDAVWSRNDEGSQNTGHYYDKDQEVSKNGDSYQRTSHRRESLSKDKKAKIDQEELKDSSKYVQEGVKGCSSVNKSLQKDTSTQNNEIEPSKKQPEAQKKFVDILTTITDGAYVPLAKHKVMQKDTSTQNNEIESPEKQPEAQKKSVDVLTTITDGAYIPLAKHKVMQKDTSTQNNEIEPSEKQPEAQKKFVDILTTITDGAYIPLAKHKVMQKDTSTQNNEIEPSEKQPEAQKKFVDILTTITGGAYVPLAKHKVIQKDTSAQNNETEPSEKQPEAQKKSVDILTAITGGAYVPPAKRKVMQKDTSTQNIEIEPSEKQPEAQKKFVDILTTRTGGVYVPPAKRKVMQKDTSTQNIEIEPSEKQPEAQKKFVDILTTRTGGAYIPPAKHKMMQKEITDKSRFPVIVELLLQRLLFQFRRSFRRNDKMTCMNTTTFLAHLINMRVVHDVLALEILTLLMENPTDLSIEIAVSFLKECGPKIQEVSPVGLAAVFDSLRQILHEGQLDKRVQYMIEVVFQMRTEFHNMQIIPEEFDLVDQNDVYTHVIMLGDAVDPQEILNIFKIDPNFVETEERYQALKKIILGDFSEV